MKLNLEIRSISNLACLTFIAAACIPIAAMAQNRPTSVDQYLGQITGLTATLHQDGTLSVSGNRIVADDGRVLIARPDGSQVWDVQPSEAQKTSSSKPNVPIDVSPIDFTVSGDDFIDKSIILRSVVVIAFGRDDGYAKLPGMTLGLDFSAVDRESIRQLVEHCQGFMGDPTDCSFRLQGRVIRGESGRGFQLVDLSMRRVRTSEDAKP